MRMHLEILLNMHILPIYLITSETTLESGCGLIVHAFLVNRNQYTSEQTDTVYTQ